MPDGYVAGTMEAVWENAGLKPEQPLMEAGDIDLEAVAKSQQPGLHLVDFSSPGLSRHRRYTGLCLDCLEEVPDYLSSSADLHLLEPQRHRLCF